VDCNTCVCGADGNPVCTSNDCGSTTSTSTSTTTPSTTSTKIKSLSIKTSSVTEDSNSEAFVIYPETAKQEGQDEVKEVETVTEIRIAVDGDTAEVNSFEPSEPVKPDKS